MGVPSSTAAALTGLLLAGAASSAFAQEPPGEWSLTVGARESGEFSRVFNGVPEEDLMMDNVNLGFGYRSRTEYSQYGFFGRAGYNNYREAENRNRFNYGGGFSWTRTPSNRFSSTLTIGVDRGFQAETLSNLGVLGPGFDSSAAHASWTLEYQTSPRTAITTGVIYDYMRFESDRPIPGSQIVPGQTPFRDPFRSLFPERRGSDDLPLPDAEEGVIDILATEGFNLGVSGSHSGTATFGLSRTLTEYSSLGFDLAGGYRTIDRGGVQLQQEGAQSAFRFWAQRRSGASGTFSTFYSLSRSLILDPANTIHTLSGGYNYLPTGRNLSLRFSGGASYYVAENGRTSLVPMVDATFTAALSRTTHLNALYQRQFAQSVGFGRTLLIDYATVGLIQRFGPKVDLSLLGGSSFGSDPLIEGSRYDAVQVGGTLTYRIVPSFAVGGSYYLTRTEQTGLASASETERNLASIFVTYTATWR